jgi:hypothetical protein
MHVTVVMGVVSSMTFKGHQPHMFSVHDPYHLITSKVNLVVEKVKTPGWLP